VLTIKYYGCDLRPPLKAISQSKETVSGTTALLALL